MLKKKIALSFFTSLVELCEFLNHCDGKYGGAYCYNEFCEPHNFSNFSVHYNIFWRKVKLRSWRFCEFINYKGILLDEGLAERKVNIFTDASDCQRIVEFLTKFRRNDDFY